MRKTTNITVKNSKIYDTVVKDKKTDDFTVRVDDK